MTDQTPDSPLLRAASAYKRALASRELAAQRRLIAAYKSLYQRLRDKIDLLAQEIGTEQPTRGQLVRMSRYKELLAQTAKELDGFQALTRLEIEQASRVGINLGAQNARSLLSYAASGSPAITGSFNRLPVGVIEQMLGFLSPDGPLYKRLGKLGEATAARIADNLVKGVGLGYNPVKIARMITDDLGSGLTDAMRMTRTAQLWAYREANRATYLANADILDGWIWYAELDDRVCMSCVVMHGTIHPLDEPLDDHHNGRCAAIPVVKAFGPIIEGDAGEKWFNEQSETTQRAMMGKSKHEAWKEGKFGLRDLPGKSEDEVYGPMTIERSLKDLLTD